MNQQFYDPAAELQLHITEHRHERRNPYAKHYHGLHELIFVIDGQGECIYNDSHAYSIAKNNLIVLPKYTAHELREKNKRLLHLYCLYFDEAIFHGFADSFIEQCLYDIAKNQPVIDINQNFMLSPVPDIFKTIIYEKKRQNNESRYVQLFKLGEMILLIKRALASLYTSQQQKSTSTEKRIAEVISYIKMNFYKTTHVENLAKKIHVSTRHFIRLFKKQTGYGLSQYITMLRIEEAKQLLCTTQKSITTICFDVGYDNVSHFYKVFKSNTGYTPKQFRQQNLTS